MKIENSSEMSHNINVVHLTTLHWFYFYKIHLTFWSLAALFYYSAHLVNIWKM